MKEIIYGEFFKSRRNRTYKIIYLVLVFLLIAYCVYLDLCMKIDTRENFFCCYLGIVDYLFPVMALFGLSFFEEYYENTLKNMTVISSRRKIYYGKILFQMTESIAVYIFAIVISMMYSFIMLNGSMNMFTVKTYIAGFIFGLLLVIRNILLADLLIMIMKNEIMIVVSYILITNYAYSFFRLIFNDNGTVSSWLFAGQVVYLKTFHFGGEDYVINLIACGFMIIVSIVLGKVIFSKSSIK